MYDFRVREKRGNWKKLHIYISIPEGLLYKINN